LTPTHHRCVCCHATCVVGTSCNLHVCCSSVHKACSVRKCRGGVSNVGGVTVSELAVVIQTPTHDRSVRCQTTGVTYSGYGLNERNPSGVDESRSVRQSCKSLSDAKSATVAELAKAAVAPTHHRSVRCQTTHMGISSSKTHKRYTRVHKSCRMGQSGWHVTYVGSTAVAELTVAARPPAHDQSVHCQTIGVHVS
jgi:hypothetical protein